MRSIGIQQMESCLEGTQDSATIRALGSLFKLTQVSLWDLGLQKTKAKSSVAEVIDDDDDDFNSNFQFTSKEDMELARQMDALGLPLSFQSNKEKRNGISKGKKWSTHIKQPYGRNKIGNEVREVSIVSEDSNVSPTVFHDNTSSSVCCTSRLDQSESCYYDAAGDVLRSQLPSGEGEFSESSSRIICGVEEDICDKLSGTVNDGQEYDSVHNHGVFEDDTKISASSTNLDTAASPGSNLKSLGAESGKKEQHERLTESEYSEASIATLHYAEGEKFGEANSSEMQLISESSAYFVCSELVNKDDIDIYDDNSSFGDWKVYWDSLYSRNYFYNIKTHVSTWYPPPGMEHVAYGYITNESNEMNASITEADIKPSFSYFSSKETESFGLQNEINLFEESMHDDNLVDQLTSELSCGIGHSYDSFVSDLNTSTVSSFEHPFDVQEINEGCEGGNAFSLLSDTQEEHIGSLTNTLHESFSEGDNMCMENVDLVSDVIDTLLEPASTKCKEKVRRKRAHRKLWNDNEELQIQAILEDCSATISKYWCQRYLLFSKYDSGIKMDEEGWFSVTPESLSRHHAFRSGNGIIVDCFTGVGGNAIQLAKRGKHVIAIDIDPKKIEYAHHNAAIYGVNDKIDFITGDFFLLAPHLKADTVFLSPPWGGPDYVKKTTYDLNTMLKPHNGNFLFDTAKRIASRIIMFLPRNVDIKQLAELSLSQCPPWSLEVEKNYLNGKLKAVTAYFNST